MTQSKARRANAGKVEFPRHYGHTPKDLKPVGEYTVAGFDIEADAETADPYLICADTSDGKQFKKTLTSVQDVLDFLTQPSFQHSINGFWNISYDSEGMLRFFPDFVKYLLTKTSDVWLTHDLKHATKDTAWYYHIKLIPKKALFIQSVISPVNRFFDFAQFYDKEPLKKISRRLLGDDKEDFDASKSSLNSYFTDPDYRAKVQSYCLHDCNLTRRIGEHLVKAVHTFIQTKNFTSRAAISEQYFLRNGYQVPQKMRFFFKWFLKTFGGGRFELTKRGFIRDTFTSDIKSAYPAHMAKMPILTPNVELVQCKLGDISKDAVYAAYKVNVQVPKDNYLGPVPVEIPNGPIAYPVGELRNLWLDKETLLYLNRKSYDYQVTEGVELFDPQARPQLEKPILQLFSLKENKKNDEGIRNTGKIIMNSGFGKSIQLIDDVTGEIMDLEVAQERGYEIEAILPEGVFASRHTGVFKAGSMFCPPYASYITAKTRIQTLDMAEYVGPENVVAIQTDSLTSINKEPYNEKGLGGWEAKGRLDLSIGKSGFYQYQSSGDQEMDPSWKIFNRIKETKARSYARIDDITQSSYIVKRRVTMKECAIRNDFTRQNIIENRSIDNNINTDQKRIWNSSITPDDLRPWGRTVDSKPLLIK